MERSHFVLEFTLVVFLFNRITIALSVAGVDTIIDQGEKKRELVCNAKHDCSYQGEALNLQTAF